MSESKGLGAGFFGETRIPPMVWNLSSLWLAGKGTVLAGARIIAPGKRIRTLWQ